jgi:translation initiation factor IF-3
MSMRWAVKTVSKDENLINEEIRVPEVRVIDADGTQLGIMKTRDAIQVAQEKLLDLVMVATTSTPPVCKIIDYGKYKYRLSKKQAESKKHQKIVKVKEIKMRPKIEDHDYNFKMAHIVRFLADGNKAKVTIMFKGRELVHPHLGKDILDRVASELKESAEVEQEAKMEGRRMSMVLSPRKHAESTGGAHAKDQD